jgi:hypothetical protein
LGHETDMAFLLRDVRSQGQSGNYMLALSFSAFGTFSDMARCPS